MCYRSVSACAASFYFHGLTDSALTVLVNVTVFYIRIDIVLRILLRPVNTLYSRILNTDVGRWAVTTSREWCPFISKLWWGKFAAPLQTTLVSGEPPLRAKGKEQRKGKGAKEPSDQHAGSGRVRAVRRTELSGWHINRQRWQSEAEPSGQHANGSGRKKNRRTGWSDLQRPVEREREQEGEGERQAVVSANATSLRPESENWKLVTQDTWCRDHCIRFGAQLYSTGGGPVVTFKIVAPFTLPPPSALAWRCQRSPQSQNTLSGTLIDHTRHP